MKIIDRKTHKVFIEHYPQLINHATGCPIIENDGILRWKGKSIAMWLLDRCMYNHSQYLNDLWRECCIGHISKEEIMEHYREIGYSLSGYLEIFPELCEEKDSPLELSKKL
jgi:hypothetical protein